MAKQEKMINPYINCNAQAIYDKMMAVRKRRGYDTDTMIWQIVIDLDKRLTEAEAEIERMRKLP